MSPVESFRHEALLYAGEDEFVGSLVPFLREGVASEEPTLVVVAAPKIDSLRQALGPEADTIFFADMADVGHNPGRIIGAWRDFVSEHGGAGRRLRGVGEPIGPDRGAEELVECQRHETLLNVAFGVEQAWWLLCPYDTEALGAEVVAEALRSHPFLMRRDTHSESESYCGAEAAAAPFGAPLSEPPEEAPALAFAAGPLKDVRDFVSRHAAAGGLDPGRTADLMLAVNEAATNSLRHGGGAGVVRLWWTEDAVICEIWDAGQIDDPLAGRRRPTLDSDGGFGLWLANQICDLVQLRTFSAGSAVRLHMTSR